MAQSLRRALSKFSRRRRVTRPRRNGRSLVPLGLVLPILVVVAWEWASQAGFIPPWQLPAPSDIFWSLVDLHASGDLYLHVGASMRRVALGFTIGSALGTAIGFSVGLSKTIERLLGSTLQAVRSVPTLGWVPLLILWFGIGETSKLTLIAIGSFFPVYVNLVAGLRGVERTLVEVGRVHSIGRWGILRRILLPAAMPEFITGLRVGLTQGWLFMVIAELMAAGEGLGFLLTMGREVARPDLLLCSLVILALLGKVTDSVVGFIERYVLAWRDTATG